jgi:ABC-type amino acid transport substrate-binding protein
MRRPTVDEDRFVNGLRRIGDPVGPDPAFLDRMYENLAGELGFRPAIQSATRPLHLRRVRRLLLLAAVVVLSLAVVGGALVAGAFLERQREDELTTGPLDRIQAAGVLRVAIRPDFPQVTIDGTFQGGFDADVATALAERLGVRPVLQAMNLETLPDSPAAAEWDLAFPGRSLTPAELARLEASVPYYEWAVYVVVSSTSSASSPADLAGQQVCVVGGSAGADWLVGQLNVQSAGSVASPPASAIPIERESDGDCLELIAADEASAAITATLSSADLAARPSLRQLGEPLFLEERRVVAPRGPGSAVAIAEVDRLLMELRDDGTLTELSRRRFGGTDLSPRLP